MFFILFLYVGILDKADMLRILILSPLVINAVILAVSCVSFLPDVRLKSGKVSMSNHLRCTQVLSMLLTMKQYTCAGTAGRMHVFTGVVAGI